MPVEKDVPNSYEGWFDQATPPTYFLNLHSAADKWLTTRRKFRQIGETAPNGLNGQFMWYAPLSSAFDALFYLRETSASQPNQPTHPTR